MRNLIPHFIQEQLLSGPNPGRSEGFSIFVDLSGFTKLTESLMQEGKNGAERLSVILNAIFAPMVDLVYQQGGFIPHFAGDAFTGIFLHEKTDLSPLQILAIAQKNFDLLNAAAVHFPEFEINIKVGIGYGEIEWGIVGGENKSFYFRGAGMDGSAEAQKYADKQQTILDAAFASMLPDGIKLNSIADSSYSLVSSSIEESELDELLSQANGQADLSISKKIAAQFLPSAVIQFNQQGEFRTVVPVFISFEGVKSHEALDTFASIVLEQINNFSGYFKEIEFGDKGGVIVTIFGAPVSYENNIERALEFISAVNEELLPMQVKGNLKIKSGIATGIAYTGIIGGESRSQYAAVGNRVNIAARLMMAAEWGETLVDEDIQKQRNFRFQHQGDIVYKGLKSKIPTYRLTGRNQGHRQSFSGAMVGRNSELRQLTQLAQGTFEKLKLGIAYVYGEAGVGKTRLSFELKSHLRKQRRLRWLACRSDQILRKPFNPFISFLKGYFSQSSENSHSLNLENFEQRFAALVNEVIHSEHPNAERIKREIIRTKSVLAALTGLQTTNSLWENLDAKGRYENTLSGLTSLFQAEALNRPVVIELEDGHWFDNSSIDFLNEFIGRAKNFPIFFLITSRYDDEGNRPTLFQESILEKNGIEAQVVDLNILGAEALKEFAIERLKGSPSETLLELLKRTSNGNPFYAEQILEYFVENDLLKREGEIWTVKDKNIRISDSIQSVLTARIDRLSNQVKETVKAAAVIGREFELPVLSEVMKGSGNFIPIFENADNALQEQVKTAERAQIWQAVNELRYIFRHALLREAVYDMQLKTRLRELHRLIAEAIESLYADNIEQHYVDLVFHYEQAEVEHKLIDYLGLAADHAKSLYQNQQAISFYEKLLDLITDEESIDRSLTSRRVIIMLRKGSILELTGKWDDCETVYRGALELARKTNDSSLLGRINNQLGHLLMLKGNYEEADTFLETSAAFFGSIHDNRGTSKVYGNLGTLYFRQGKYEDAKLYFIRSIQLAQLYKHSPSNAQIVATLGLTYMNLGKYDDGIRWQQSQLDLCKRVNDRRGMASLFVNMGIVYFEKGDYDAALDCYQRGLELSEELGNKQLTAIAIGSIGNIYQRKGNFELAMQNFELDLDLVEELGDRQGIAIANGLIGELCGLMGQFNKAISYLEKNLAISKDLGYQKGVAKALNNLGDIYFYKKDYHTSIQFYDRCMTVTREIGNKLVLGFSLVEKSQVLIAIKELEEAKGHLEEASKISEELNQPDLMFETQLVSAKLNIAKGDTEQAESILNKLLEDKCSDKDKAAIHYEYSKIEKGDEHCKKSLAIYEKLFERTPVFLYSLRIKTLKEQ